MYLTADEPAASKLLAQRQQQQLRNDEDDAKQVSFENPWILYTIVAACILLSLLAIVATYDLCCKFCDRRGQQISDGGPPASPGHNHTYTVTIKADEASVTFDTRQSVLKMELLDDQNQYLTSLALPCYVFKFKEVDKKYAELQSNSPPMYTNPQQPPGPSFAYKSMSAFNDDWANTTRSNQITFNLVRRMPLKNLSSVRLSHDCYTTSAQITLKYIIVRDDQATSQQQPIKFNLNSVPIRALSACPPSGYQVFHANHLTATGQAVAGAADEPPS